MTAARRALALCAGGLFVSMGLGCEMSSHLTDRESTRLPEQALRPPAWLNAGAMPMQSAPALPALPEPDLFSAQNESHLGVPRVEEERSAANHSVEGNLPAVTPVSAVSPMTPASPIVVPAVTPLSPSSPSSPALPVAEANWKPAGGFRAP
jgi:hypothetical protein